VAADFGDRSVSRTVYQILMILQAFVRTFRLVFRRPTSPWPFRSAVAAVVATLLRPLSLAGG